MINYDNSCDYREMGTKMELEVGMYVRTNEGIGTIHKLSRGKIYNVKFNKGHIKKWVSILKEPSFNIMDMIGEGDYVNGFYVEDVFNTYIYVATGTNYFQSPTIYEQDIKSIVTKEQFEQISYKVSD